MIIAIRLEVVDADSGERGVYTDYVASFATEQDARSFLNDRKDILLVDADVGKPINTACVSIGEP